MLKIRIRSGAAAFAIVMIFGVGACSQGGDDEMETPAQDAAGAMPEPAQEPAPAGDLLARGEYLVESIVGCGNCHSSRTSEGEFIEGMEYAGNFVITEPGFTAYAPNITPDMETGIGGWSDEDVIHAIREGVRPDGQVLGPPMSFIFYRNISDTDIRAIVAYLRSVPAVRHEVPRSTYDIPLPPNWGPPVGEVADVPRDDAVAYGGYLVNALGHCTDCHTPLVDGVHDFSRRGAGGNIFHQPFGYTWAALAANITQHEELGIGAWTDDEIKRAITQGISRDGRELLPFMGFSFYAKISDEDLDAIVAYLRTLPPAVVPPAE